MANPLGEIFRPLVRGFGEAASKAKPFYSGVDQAISAITQNKGTGKQRLVDILKTAGNAGELRDRPVVRAALNQPKITKEQLQKIATDNPAPQFTEKTRGESAFEAEADRRAAEMKRFRVNEIMDEMNPDSLPQSAEQWKAARLNAESVVQDEEKQIRQNVVDVLHDEGDFYTKFEKYTIPGGTNDREILFQLPDNRAAAKAKQEEIAAAANAKYNDIAAKANAESRLMTTEEVAERLRLEGEIRRPVPNQPYFDNPHYSEKNILAHARVSDRFEPNGDKALHIEELQSDLHQRARDIRKTEIKRLIDSGVSKTEANKQVPVEYGYQFPEKESRAIKSRIAEIESYGLNATPEQKQEWVDLMNRFQPETQYKKVPDSPFKENWHEVVMKRLLDDAVKNGYKKVYITPGAEQAKRYNLSKHINEVHYSGTNLKAYDHQGNVVINKTGITSKELPEYIGKELADRLMSVEPSGTLRSLVGEDIKVGGEGMLGFYDKIMPSFVNDYGAPHNMRMNLHDTQVGGNKYTVFEDSNPDPFSVVREGGSAIASRHGTREEAEAAAAELSTQPLHSITITPEFEKHVQEKGQRLYQAIPAGIGAGIGAEALTEEEPAPMKKGGPVSLDAMRLAVMNKKVQHKQYGGPTFVRSGISRIRKNMNPVRGNTIIKEGGGNWMSGEVERGLKGLKRNETPLLPITEAEIASVRNEGYTVYDPVTGTFTKPNPTNQFVDKQLTKYVKNQMGTKDDPIRLAADSFPAQKAKLLAEKQVQIDKATADMEKARQLRGYTPEMMTESQKIIRKLEKENELIERREGLHFKPFELHTTKEHQSEMRRKAGMPTENLGQTENAKNWENLADRNIESSTAKSWTEGSLYAEPLQSNPWLQKVDPESKVYTGRDLERGLGFDHMMDELRNATNPTSGLPKELLIDPKLLSKWTIPQAAEHVDKINAWRASQTAEANRVIANNAATFLHKDYPEKGMKWVELRAQKNLPEGYTGKYDDLIDIEYKDNPNPELYRTYRVFNKEGQEVFNAAAADIHHAKKPEDAAIDYFSKGTLADALKYEGEQLQTCVAGYCPDVISGKSRIFSLRDSAGKPYVTVEVKPSGILTNEDFGANDLRIVEGRGEFGERGYTTTDNKFFETYSDAVNHEQKIAKPNLEVPSSIHQIKGKGNAAPSEEYLPYVQDFVRSGKWSDVQDLQNTGLTRHKDKYFTEPELEDYTNSIINPTKDWYHNSPYYKTYRQLNDNLDSKGDLYKDINNWSGRMHIPVGTQRYSISDIHGVLSEPRGYDLSTLEDVRDAVNWLKTNQPEIPKHLLPETPPPMEGMKRGGVVHMDKGGIPEQLFGVAETPEQELLRYLRMFRVNASGGKDQYGADMGGRFGINIPLSQNVSIEPYVQGSAYKPNSGKVERGGIAGANLNIRFNNGGAVSDDAMRMAVMNKQLRKHHG